MILKPQPATICLGSMNHSFIDASPFFPIRPRQHPQRQLRSLDRYYFISPKRKTHLWSTVTTKALEDVVGLAQIRGAPGPRRIQIGTEGSLHRRVGRQSGRSFRDDLSHLPRRSEDRLDQRILHDGRFADPACRTKHRVAKKLKCQQWLLT